MNKLAFTIFLFIFIILRPYVMQSSGLWYYGDDQDYFAHASSIVFGQFPSYKKEYLTIDKEYPQSSIGCALLSVPFVWVFSLIDRFNHSNIIETRTAGNISGSWTQYGFILASCFYFSLACFLLYRAILSFTSERIAYLSIVIVVLCEGLPLYPFKRPMFSHTIEFFLQSLFVFIVLNKISFKQIAGASLKQFFVWGVLGALVALTRYNNIAYAVGWPLMLILIEKSLHKTQQIWLKASMTILGFLAMLFVFKIWPEIYNQHHPYPWVMKYLARELSFQDVLTRLEHIFLGIDWGMIYTAPYILLGIIMAITITHNSRKYLLWAIAALIINFYVIIVWGSQGSWHGYRYIIASAAPLAVLPIALFIKNVEEKFSKKLTWLWFLLATTSFLSMICYEANSSTFDVYIAPVDLGESDFTNYLYQFHVWQVLLFKPFELLSIFSSTGFGYIQYLITLLLNQFGMFQDMFFRNYASFNLSTLIKTMLIYATPFVVVLLFRFRFKKY